MSDEEQEYEVESIQEAVVEKKRGKNGQLFWQFRVRWKGYTAEDDTWEPIESFEESGQIVDDFWSRTKDVRDIRDLKKFRVGERFLPMGPPKKLRKKKSTVKAESHHQGAVKPTPEPSKPACDTNGPTILPISITPPPPAKRRRGVLETDTEERASKRQRDSVAAKSNGNTPAKTPGKSGSNLGLTTPTPARRQSARRRKPSPEVIPDSDEEVAQFMKVDDDLDSEDGIGSTSPPGSTNPATFDPLFDEDPEPQAPPHRLKKRNPLVKPFEEPALSTPQGQLSAKSRALGTNRKASSSSSRKDGTSASASQRPGPGRSSGGMVKKPVASLLTAAKGALKTIKGSYRRPVEQEQDQKQEDQDILSEAKEAGSPSMESIVPEEPPTAEELLTLAGYDKQDAEALPDFEDSGASTDTQVGGDVKDSVLARERAESLKKAKESLFPTSAASSDLPSAKWNFSTIFGPLTAEPSSSTLPMEGGPDHPKSSPFSLNLDASTSVPVLFTDAVGGGQLGTSIPVVHKSPPGQFYSQEASGALLNAVRSSGEAGRVIMRSDVSQDLKQHFLRFSERLHAGDLFVATAGFTLYAFCSSDNRYHCSRMNISPGLQVAKGQVLVCKVAVGDFSGYAEVAGRADSRQWSQYVASLA